MCTLLAVLQQHPAARAALKLPRGKPVPPPPPPPPPAAAAAADTAAAAGSSAAANGGSGGDGRAGISSGGRAASLDSDAGAALANPFAGLGFAQTPGVAAAAAAPGDDAPQPPLPAAAAPASHKQALADGLAALAAAAGVPDGSPPPATTAAAAGDGTAPSTSPSLLPGAAKVAAQPQAQPQPPPQFGPDDVSTSPVVASLQASVVAWLGTATAVLAATRVCLRWEPLVTPPLPGMPPAPPLPPLTSVNLTTVPVDAWLTLLQAACQAVRGLVALHGYAGLKAIYRHGQWSGGGCTAVVGGEGMTVKASRWRDRRGNDTACACLLGSSRNKAKPESDSIYSTHRSACAAAFCYSTHRS